MLEKGIFTIDEVLGEPCNIRGKKQSPYSILQDGPTLEFFLENKARKNFFVRLVNAFRYSEGVGLYAGVMIPPSQPMTQPTDIEISEEIYKMALKKNHQI